jgi:hypothetical protein
MALLDARALCIALEGGAEMGDALATYARLRR